jgi:hypothetical protein
MVRALLEEGFASFFGEMKTVALCDGRLAIVSFKILHTEAYQGIDSSSIFKFF